MGGWKGWGWAAGWRPCPCLQPLEGGVISPPFGGIALLVAVAAGVPHVVQRHHHLIWVRVFVQFHHARHHRGPAICSEHGGSERWESARAFKGRLLCTRPSTAICRFTKVESGLREVKGLAQEHTGVNGTSRIHAGSERLSTHILPTASHALSVVEVRCPRHPQAAKETQRTAHPTLPFHRCEH